MTPNTHFVIRVATIVLVSLGAFTVASRDRYLHDGKPVLPLGPGALKEWVHEAHPLEIQERRAMPQVLGWHGYIAPTRRSGEQR